MAASRRRSRPVRAWRSALTAAALAAAAVAGAVPRAGAQADTRIAPAAPGSDALTPGVTAPGLAAPGWAALAAPAVPFGPGERARYEVRFGPAVVGRGSIEITAVERVRGRAAYRTSFRVRGGLPFYRVDDRLESWIDVETLASLRHVQATREGRRARERRYEIYPERGVYAERAGPAAAAADAAADGAPAEERPTVARPLDEGAFVQFVRTVPLVVGERRRYDDYFKPDRNPVTVEVLRRERVRVPAGTFDAVVIRPAFRTKGVFARAGGTEVWLSDDARRVVLRVRTHLPFGALTLALTDYVPPDAAGPTAPGLTPAGPAPAGPAVAAAPAPPGPR